MNVNALFNIPTKEKVEAEIHHLKPVVAAAVGALNTLVGAEMYEALAQLRKTPLYRQRLKAEAEAAYKEYCKFEAYYRRMYDADIYSFFINYLDCMEEEAKPAVRRFREAVIAAMVRYGQEYPEMKACFITTRTLANISCDFFDGLLSDSRVRCGMDVSAQFKNARLTSARYRWINANDCLFSKSEGTKDLREDPACLDAFNALEKLLGNEDTLNRVGRKAILASPFIYNNLSDEDKKIIDNEKSYQKVQ